MNWIDGILIAILLASVIVGSKKGLIRELMAFFVFAAAIIISVYKIATVKETGRRDQMGGALIGFLRGWLAIGFLTLLVFLLPMPSNFYTSFESSFFGPTVAKTIPLLYEGTSFVHPNNTKFITKIENTLLDVSMEPGSDGELSDNRAEVFRVMRQFDLFFNISSNES
jgi:uncharacterized membrane protein required for colicin V production